jgi:hypothetical protein
LSFIFEVVYAWYFIEKRFSSTDKNQGKTTRKSEKTI